MTKKELKEAIASTIIENNQKGITATTLANLLNEIVDAAGSGSGGSNTLIFNLRLDKETGEPITTPSDENLQFRQTLIEGINNNKSYGVLVNMCMDMSDVLEIVGSSGKYITIESGIASYIYINAPGASGTTLPDLPEDEVLMLNIKNATDPTVTTDIIINSDGSITIDESTSEESTTE